MVALALALAYVATLALVGLFAWMRWETSWRRAKQVVTERYVDGETKERVDVLTQDVRVLGDKVSALQLAQGLRVEKRRD